MRRSFWIILAVALLPASLQAQTRWMRLHPDVSWKYLKHWEKKHSWLAPAWEGKLLFQKGEMEKARRQLEKALAEGSEDGRLFYELAYCYQAEGKTEKARDLYLRAAEKLSRDDPEHLYLFNSHYLLGSIYEEEGKTGEAIEQYGRALQLRPDAAALHYRKACALYRRGDPEGSAAELQVVVKLEPGAAPAHYLLGLLYLDRNELDLAQGEFEEAISADQEMDVAYYCLGHIASRRDRTEEAAARYAAALDLNPDQLEARIALANLSYERDDLVSAESHFAELVRLQPASARWHYNLGVIYRQMEKPDLAAGAFRKASALDPDLVFTASLPAGLEGVTSEADLLYAQGRFEEAARLYRRALREDPFYTPNRFNLALAYGELEKNNQAIREYKKLLRSEPDYSAAHLNLGILAYRKARNSQLAAHHLRRYLELEPESKQAELIERYLHEIRGW